MHAPPKSDYPVAEPEKLLEYDAFLFGIPTRYGNFPAQWKAFWDKTGGIWAAGGFAGKYAGLFVSTASLGGGQETTALNAMSTLAHHGIIYVPLGYSKTFAQLTNLSEVHGGSAWGAGTVAVSLPECFSYPRDRPANSCSRLVTALASHPLSSSRSPRPRVSPSTRSSPRSTSRDYMVSSRESLNPLPPLGKNHPRQTRTETRRTRRKRRRRVRRDHAVCQSATSSKIRSYIPLCSSLFSS